MASFGPADPVDHDVVRATVRRIEPDWRDIDIAPIQAGSDVLYEVTAHDGGEDPDADARRHTILKLGSFGEIADPEALRVESRLLDRIGAATDVPVPTVYGRVDDDPDLPTPAYLMAYRPGRTLAPADRSRAIVRRVARDAGRHLGRVHELDWDLDGFGDLAAVDDRVGVADPGRSWRDWLAWAVSFPFEAFPDRFADLLPDLRERAETAIDRIEGPFDPTVCHCDYRYDNLRVDADGGTRAALDWGGSLAAPAAYDLVKTESMLCSSAPLDSRLRETVRTALRSGYAETATVPAGLDRNRRVYLLVDRLHSMRWLPYWHDDATDAHRDRVAAAHRSFVAALP
ncbi:hypothetical protein BRD17_00975 [Halobacteriales archaeon SW_7_68_16]|nr:MAG: hypothetical protein BRD17_00975 [Halobacteriales archaeon SW_7_68_16]